MVKKIYIAGHNGMVGSAIKKILIAQGETNIITRSKSELDLTNQALVKEFFREEKPDQVYLAAAKVGGILANSTYPAEFIYENIMIQANIINSSFLSGVKELLFLGSSCIYPKFAEQPMKEDLLLTGALEATNEPYAIAKIAGIKLCESYNRQYKKTHGLDYRSIMPTNLYGPGDNYSLEYSHVIPALIRRFHEAKIKQDEKVVVWGSGNIKREFLYVEDLAKAAIHVMGLSQEEYYKHTSSMCSHINIGSGSDLTIKDLAAEIKHVIGYVGRIEYDAKMPDGMPRKLLSTRLINKLGWRSEKKLRDGLKDTYKSYINDEIKREK
tara:strand:- start:122 stop:1096 length:975 start_codon:yes stop_codon:yes gene_type:complete